MGPLRNFSLALTACSLGCSDEPMDLEELYMATGASWTVESSAICASFGCGLNAITSVTPGSSSVVEVTDIGDSDFTLRALSEGETTVNVVGTQGSKSGQSMDFRLLSRLVDVLDFETQCNVLQPSEAPFWLPTDAEVTIRWEMFDALGTELSGDPGFDVGDLMLTPSDVDDNEALLTMPDTVVNVDIASPLMTDSVASFGTFAVDAPDGFDLEWATPEPLDLGEIAQVSTALLVDRQRICQDTAMRAVRILTPEICSFAKEDWVEEIEQDSPIVRVFSRELGVCTVEVSVPDFGWTESLSVEIVTPTVDPGGESPSQR